MATLFTSGMTRTVTFIPSANGSSSGGSRCIFKACWSFCTLSILAPLSLPEEAGTSGNTGKFAGQRTARKIPASNDHQPGRHGTNPTRKGQGLLRLYSQYNRPGSPNIIPAIKTISLSHHYQAGPLERTVENEIDRLLMEFESGYIQDIAARYKKNYDGRKHGQYCNQIKNATRTRRETTDR